MSNPEAIEQRFLAADAVRKIIRIIRMPNDSKTKSFVSPQATGTTRRVVQMRAERLMPSLFILVLLYVPARGQDGVLPDNDIVTRALVEELERSMEQLVFGELPKPYYIQYNAQDRLTYSLRAAYGGLLANSEDRTRYAVSRVRVGSYELDNTNVGRGFGARISLPLDDDLVALRHALWRMTDGDYKQAVETLARKIAYLKQKSDKERPDDFSPVPAVHVIEPSAEIAIDRTLWEKNVLLMSERFARYADIQNATVTLFAGAVNQWLVNSEGSRLRTADTGVHLQIRASIQADDGMRLSDGLEYLGLQTDDLPPMDQILTDIDETCAGLIKLSHAPVLEHYSGPVLFEPAAAGRVLDALLAEGFCARPIPLGSSGNDNAFDKKIGRRILPRTFYVYDDPQDQRFEGTVLAGAYTFDDEGTKSQRVVLVEKGILKTMLAGRAPTKKIKQSTGHARSNGFGDAEANIGCLYVSDEQGLEPGPLKDQLIKAAREEGLDYALRVESIRSGSPGALGRPIHAFKVFLDGHEERVRGMKFLPVQARELKHLLAAGVKRKAFNSSNGVGRSIITPALLFEELELTKIEREFDKKPILPSPLQRSVVGN